MKIEKIIVNLFVCFYLWFYLYALYVLIITILGLINIGTEFFLQ